MKFLCAILLSILLSNTQAEIYTCYYNGDDFHVIQDGFKKSYYAKDGFANATLGCSSKLAAIYDGDDLVIFDDDIGDFKRVYVNHNFHDSKMVVTESLIGFYDGKDFYVYTLERKAMERHFADDYIDRAQLAYFDTGVALYDGDDLLVYDLVNSDFHIHYVDNLRKSFQLIGAGHGVLFYDGDEVVSYCKKSFMTLNAVNNKPVQILGIRNEERALVIDEDIFLLDKKCHLLKINGFE